MLTAEYRFLPCWLAGHSLACALAISASVTVLLRFRECLLRMRRGDNPYSQMLKAVPLSSFSDSATPTLGGMVR